MILIAVVMSCSVFALGIGTNNKAVPYEPEVKKAHNVYIINDEKKDMYVDISIAGSLSKYAKAPKTVFVPASEEIKRIIFEIELPKGMKKGDLKAIVSETTVAEGQIAAKVHAVTDIKIGFSSEKKQNEEKEEKKEIMQFGEQEIEVQKATPSGVEEEVVVKYNTGHAFIIFLTTVIAVTVLIDLTFYHKKKKAEHIHQHLTEYIVEELESGKSKDEIKQNLMKHGWGAEKIDSEFEELKKDIGRL